MESLEHKVLFGSWLGPNVLTSLFCPLCYNIQVLRFRHCNLIKQIENNIKSLKTVSAHGLVLEIISTLWCGHKLWHQREIFDEIQWVSNVISLDSTEKQDYDILKQTINPYKFY